METLKSSSSCKFLLLYHFIFVTKYRRKILNDSVSNDLKKIFLDISLKYSFKIHAQEIDKDHIHLMIESIPTISCSQICRVLKQESTIAIWKLYNNYLSNFYWKERTIWSDGYFVSTIGNVSEQTLRHYIETQGS